MDKIANMPARDRSDLFRAVAETKGVMVQIIEKDFWVCWALRHLYAIDTLDASLYFKGGTSLSKVFGIIERMSEDIDLVIDRVALGFTGDKDPTSDGISGNARNRLIKELKATAAQFVDGPLYHALHDRFTEQLDDPSSWSLDADISNLDNTCIYFNYPSLEDPSEYLRPMVMFELGARGDAWPSVEGTLTPYAAEIMPDLFTDSETTVSTITAERTFWEKSTLLHTLAHRDTDRVIQMKPARHYYDVYQLSQHDSGRNAIQDIALLVDVVKHKKTFYPRASDRYDLAIPETLRLVPDEETVKALHDEYKEMAEIMVFGDAPDFDTVLNALSAIEKKMRNIQSI